MKKLEGQPTGWKVTDEFPHYLLPLFTLYERTSMVGIDCSFIASVASMHSQHILDIFCYSVHYIPHNTLTQ